MNSSGNRLVYIDALRGIAMLLVLYSHVLMWVFGVSSSEINAVFIKFRMPLFFFISGFFAYSAKYTGELLRRRSANRLVRQLYPTLLLSSMFAIICYTGSYRRFLYDVLKCGYWFTYVAVEMFFVVAPLLYFFHKRSLSDGCRTVLLCLWGAALSLPLVASQQVFASVLATPLCNLFCVGKLVWYLPFFILGMVFRINMKQIERLLVHPLTFVVNLVLLLVLQPMLSHHLAALFVGGIAGIGAMYFVAYRLFTRRAIAESRISQRLQTLGRNTLEVYLLHYFLINILRRTHLADPLHHWATGGTEFPFVLMCSVLLGALCMAVVGLLRRCGLHGLLFPGNGMPQLPQLPIHLRRRSHA